MLVEHNEFYFNEALNQVVERIVGTIDRLVEAKIKAIDDAFLIFSDAKCLIPFEEAAEKKAEYSILEYYFNDFHRDVESFKDNDCLERLQEFRSRGSLKLHELESLIDAFVQFEKAERILYDDCMLFVSSSFVDEYVKKRPSVYIGCIHDLKDLARKIELMKYGFDNCRNDLIELKQQYLYIYQQAGVIEVLLEWVQKNLATVNTGHYSIGSLLLEFKKLEDRNMGAPAASADLIS